MTPDVTKQVLTSTAETVLARRYYLKDSESNPIETWETLTRRVADAVAEVDRDQKNHQLLQEDFFNMIYRLDFLPNSPCLMNAGTDLGQLSACFVLPVEDSMDGIFTAIRNGALVHKTGGGTGYAFSRLRSQNASVRSTQGVASGPLSFAAVFDAATETIKQGGNDAAPIWAFCGLIIRISWILSSPNRIRTALIISISVSLLPMFSCRRWKMMPISI